jgi:hypothetical protein
MMKMRIITTIFILFALFLLPYWIYLPILFLSLLVFPFFWEGIILAFVVDTLYGFGGGTDWVGRFPMALIAAIIFLVVPLARKYLRINA